MVADKKVVEHINQLTDINDEIIKEYFRYDKYLTLMDNHIVMDYLNNRYKDSESALESLQRIRFGIEEKPKCPTCGKPVKWIGKKSKLYTKYCCNKCSANNPNTVSKRKQTLKDKWGTENCYDSSLYQKHLEETIGVKYHTQRIDIKEKRKETLISNYGTTKLYQVPEIKNKTQMTINKKYGVDSVFQLPEIKEKAYKSLISNGYGTSKAENAMYLDLIALNYTVERFKRTDIFPYNIDFYLADYDLYIEYQGSQYHNGRPFIGDEADLQEVENLLQKDYNLCCKTGKTKSQYKSIVNTWTKYDVNKRKYAHDHNLRYLEIYRYESIEDLDKLIKDYLTENKIIG